MVLFNFVAKSCDLQGRQSYLSCVCVWGGGGGSWLVTQSGGGAENTFSQ